MKAASITYTVYVSAVKPTHPDRWSLYTPSAVNYSALMPTPSLDPLAANVRALRRRLRLSVEVAADIACLSQARWYAIEAAEHDPSLTELAGLSRALGVPMSAILDPLMP